MGPIRRGHAPVACQWCIATWFLMCSVLMLHQLFEKYRAGEEIDYAVVCISMLIIMFIGGRMAYLCSIGDTPFSISDNTKTRSLEDGDSEEEQDEEGEEEDADTEEEEENRRGK
eukprot:gnl/MRDRNA2_/MRDRNA2_108422_c0_seq1.p2 gnl/MRDRNA2_/MRDRNA2_108422_c0~~gnl/MRDRNA2_/MRDRNA2_108422_c0_seq1.p2  ORF type:complete len:114 (-),score=24.57 gnl/MRDRNA2_/MRDRNA2_108422_c0_seq1:44-385(-)